MNTAVSKKGNINNVLIAIGVVILIIGVLVFSFVISSVKDGNERKQAVTLESAGFKEVSVSKYIELLNGTEKSIILVARPTCGYCVKFTPILKEAADDLKLVVNYVNTDNFTEKDWNSFSMSTEYLQNEEWGTPLTMIVQNGIVVDTNEGYAELETIKEFFVGNGLGE